MSLPNPAVNADLPRDIAPQCRIGGDRHPISKMSAGERWVYRYVALVLFALIVLVIIDHIPGIKD